jgi:DNA-binding winged helix-turn-helix (wHTH) protein/Tol biopolymer transport system component
VARSDEPREAPLLQFGGFTLDQTRRGLYRNGSRVHLTLKPLETLIYLLERRGRTVEKQELLDAIWKDTAVTEDTLVQAVHEIRRVLGDDKTDPKFLQTVPRRGYRFVATVTTTPADLPDAVAEPPPALSPVLAGTASASATPHSFRVWRAVMFAGLAVLIVVVLIAALLRRPAAGPSVSAALEQLTPEAINAGKPALSPEGNMLYNSGGALHIKLAGSDTSLQITDQISPSGDMPVFTADGSHVVFSVPRNGEDGSRLYDLYIVGAVGGRPRLFIPEASGAGFSPDGRWVAYTKHLSGAAALWISAVDGLDRHIEVRAGGFVPRWSRDGRWIAYTTADPNATSGELWMVPVSSAQHGELQLGDHLRLTREPQSMYGLSWDRDGRSIIVAARRAGEPMHLYRVSTTGDVTALTSGPGDYTCPTVSPDGTAVIFRHGTSTKNLMVADGLSDSEPRSISEDEYHLGPVLSPSATHVASVVHRPSYEGRLHLTEIATRKRIALSPHRAYHPSWVDDRTVAYLTDTGGGGTEVRLVRIDAAPSSLELTAFSSRAAWLAVHPAKTAVAVVLSGDPRGQRIVVRTLDGRATEQTIAEGGEYEHLRWLPDGSTLSWSGPERSSDPESNGIWIAEPGRSPRRIVGDGYGPVWSGDGTIVYFSRIRDYAGLWMHDRRSDRTTQLREWVEGRYDFDIVGDRLLLTQEAGPGRVFSMAIER